MKNPISVETQQQAMAVARATQKSGQTKEQTRLIAQGIEKGIAEYKKRQKAQSRERDKHRKQQLKDKAKLVLQEGEAAPEASVTDRWQLTPLSYLLLGLLLLSWGFIGYLLQ